MSSTVTLFFPAVSQVSKTSAIIFSENAHGPLGGGEAQCCPESPDSCLCFVSDLILQQIHSHVCCLSRNWPCTRAAHFTTLHILHCLLSQNNFCESERGKGRWDRQGAEESYVSYTSPHGFCPKYIIVFIISREFQKSTN